jgi:hypothetical protein
MTKRGLRLALLALFASLLVACENSATSYTMETNQHALILVREQPYFWDKEVNQYIIASRLPTCQRRIAIHPDAKTLTPIDVFEAGYLMWALRQGDRWYLVGTERCLVQDWSNPSGDMPGPAVGQFRAGPDKPVFVPAGT